MITQWILQIKDFIEEFKQYIQQGLQKNEEPIEDHNIDYTIYFHPEHFDGEINEFYRLICNKQTNETYVHQKLKQN
jgi:hypothetical protein